MPKSDLFKITTVISAALLISACSSGPATEQSWKAVKDSAAVSLADADKWETPQALSIATPGWEDGINVSRDGLHLYATYLPADLLSFVLAGDFVWNLPDYKRGPDYGMDFDGSALLVWYEWLHSDIIYASRPSGTADFGAWELSDMARPIYSEGAISFVQNDDGTIDTAVFTSNEKYSSSNDEELNNFKIFTDTSINPSGTGEFLTSVSNQGTSMVNTLYTEDNPHIERIDSSSLVLFFDSPDRPGGEGGLDIWYSVSSDNGNSWSEPAAVSSINTASTEHQPHLYNDGTDWWLYYSAYHTDDKLGIFRAQKISDDWNSWNTPELVISAGNTAGVGEPTLTESGDIFFVVILENPEGTDIDRYDGDPWMAKAK